MVNVSTLLEAKKLTEILSKHKKIEYFINNSGHFNDEPYTYSYSFRKDLIVGGGISTFSSQLAMIKALHEFTERTSLYLGSKYSLNKSVNISSIKKNILLNTQYNFSFTKNSLVELQRLDNDENFYIHKELIFLNNNSRNEVTSCGTASGFNKDKTKLKAMSELLDADAALLWFYGVLKGSLIDLNQVNDTSINQLIEQLDWYKLQLFTIQVVNDVGVPTYISFIFDKTEHEPAISTGFGNGMFGINGLIHSIEESLNSRYYIKSLIIQSKILNNKLPILNKDLRAVYWSTHKKAYTILQRLKKLKKDKVIFSKINRIEEIVKNYIKIGNMFFLADITPDFLKKIDYVVYKVITHDLQRLYLDERFKNFNITRIKQLDKNFAVHDINSLPPHPFI